MKLATTLELYAGGVGSGCNPQKGRCGRKSSGAFQRSQRARSSYNPVTKEKRLAAAENEKQVAASIGGQHVGDSAPFDVLKGKTGIEVKTIIPGAKNDKVTVHPKSRRYKEEQAKEMNIKKTFLVAIDTRKGRKDVYIKPGIGAYRLKNMQLVENGFDGLKKFL